VESSPYEANQKIDITLARDRFVRPAAMQQQQQIQIKDDGKKD
jgi:hypothetical protein